MKPQDARKELEARQQELTALEMERDQLAVDLGALNNERNATVRALARGGRESREASHNGPGEADDPAGTAS